VPPSSPRQRIVSTSTPWSSPAQPRSAVRVEGANAVPRLREADAQGHDAQLAVDDPSYGAAGSIDLHGAALLRRDHAATVSGEGQRDGIHVQAHADLSVAGFLSAVALR